MKSQININSLINHSKINARKISVSIFFFLFLQISLFHTITAQPIPKSSHINIVNGKIWIPKLMNTNDSQLFLKSLEIPGTIRFNSNLYKNILLGYDLEQNEILTTIKTRNDTKRIIALCKSDLEEFSINWHGQDYHFKRGDLLHPDLSKTSFYQFISTKKLTYIIERKKIKTLTYKSKKHTFLDLNKIYIAKKGVLYQISRKRDLIALLDSNEAKVKQYIKSHKLKISPKYPTDAIPLILAFDL
jgi:hypothetical protein